MFADPKTDFVFKRIFGTVEHKALLIALLNDMLELDGERRILDVQNLSGDQHVAIPELKHSIVDVKCKDASGRFFVVEMQVLNVEGFEKRVVYNASKAYVMQLPSAGGYRALCDVIGVTICDFNLWPERDASGQYKLPMLSRWRMQEQQNGEHGLPQVQYVFLELPKYTAGDAPQTLVDRWAYFFRETNNLDTVPSALSEQPFRGALEIARVATFTLGEWDAYDRAKMAEQDARGALTLARREGQAHGQAQGQAQAKRDFLIHLLARSRLILTKDDQERVTQCTDLAVLDRWLDSALSATTVTDVFS
jgi:predicted transposase/invertase (TIGR01784 family)